MRRYCQVRLAPSPEPQAWQPLRRDWQLSPTLIKVVAPVFGERADVPAIRSVQGALRDAFAKQGNIDVFAEYFDFARFPAEQYEAELVARVLIQTVTMYLSTNFL